MIGEHFNNSTVRRAIAVFGTLFNNITIERGGKSIPVGIAHGPREKWLEEARALQKNNEGFDKILPRMSYEMITMNYDVNRKLNSNQRVTKQPATLRSERTSTFTPVPYNLDFILYVQAKTLGDGWQIIEQILPFFTPAYTIKVRDAYPSDNHDNEVDMPILLNSCTWSDDWQGSFEDKRVLEWQLDFTVKSNFYGPSTEIGIIYDSRIRFIPTDDVNDPTSNRRTIRIDSDSEIIVGDTLAEEIGFATLDSDAVDSDGVLTDAFQAKLDSDGIIKEFIDSEDGRIYRFATDIQII